MLDSLVVVGLFVALGVAAATFVGVRQLARLPWGRLAVLGGAGLVPLAMTGATLTAGVRESSRTRFCLECHEMEPYGKSLFVDNRQALAAVHYQERLIERDNTCYACHTDYAMFGDFKAKLNGLKHVYVHYLGDIPEDIELYQPYPNYNCLHCHADARRYVENPAHDSISAALTSGETSCLQCHRVAHDMQGVGEGNYWAAEPEGAR